MIRLSKLMIVLALLIGIKSVPVLGQDSTKSSIRTVFSGKKSPLKLRYLGLYVAPEYQFGQVGGSFTSLTGGSVMLQFNKKLALGFTGYSTVRGTQNNVNGMFAGLKTEYTVMPDAAIHVSFPLMFGVASDAFRFGEFGEHHDGFRGGDRGMPDSNFDPNAANGTQGRFPDRNNFTKNYYSVVQPGVVAEANLMRFAKIFVGANYRFAFDNNGLSSDYKGFSANVGLKLGIFDYALSKKSKKKTDN
ncbi:hypothetical protein Emtol_3564 [Emticicia oligotrophica DSM 17448]|uniref:Outer membrane protein beta-barrel domain-containing protein n=1 Tax=Emticicia oligotrophica (strain DSM 17448 / CIP 109782 / MTCC 6937 / GPTSA100-15) TaxID=929562 RepID=A0ABM5N5A4_EMTOG|nr:MULTISPECIES: hypothetical protein [Emticicia]AFK04690.1 hypothetical protein Emtol_3564 [Emticicia oligotrophica DSM 17448]